MKQIPLIVPRHETVQIFEPSKFQLAVTNLNLVSKTTPGGLTHASTHVARRKIGFPKQTYRPELLTNQPASKEPGDGCPSPGPFDGCGEIV